jgi:hypothetical protein
VLIDSRTGTVGYVGLSASPEYRFRRHCGEPGGHGEPYLRGSRKHNWLCAIRAAGSEPRLLILDTSARDATHGKELERKWIALYRLLGEAPGNGHDRPRPGSQREPNPFLLDAMRTLAKGLKPKRKKAAKG